MEKLNVIGDLAGIEATVLKEISVLPGNWYEPSF